MTFSYRRTYRGPIEAVLLDWAGTTMDFGCVAPAVVFVEVFARQGVPITIEEARAPMGAHKRVHIQRITELESVRARWHAKHGHAPDDADVSRMFAAFVPLQLQCLSDYSTLIPGTLDTPATDRIGQQYQDGTRLTMTYDAASRRTVLNDWSGLYTSTYDSDDRLGSTVNPAGIARIQRAGRMPRQQHFDFTGRLLPCFLARRVHGQPRSTPAAFSRSASFFRA